MCISLKKLDMLYLMFISAHMILKEKFGVFMPLHFGFVQGKPINGNRKQEWIF